MCQTVQESPVRLVDLSADVFKRERGLGDFLRQGEHTELHAVRFDDSLYKLRNGYRTLSCEARARTGTGIGVRVIETGILTHLRKPVCETLDVIGHSSVVLKAGSYPRYGTTEYLPHTVAGFIVVSAEKHDPLTEIRSLQQKFGIFVHRKRQRVHLRHLFLVLDRPRYELFNIDEPRFPDIGKCPSAYTVSVRIGRNLSFHIQTNLK